MANGDLSMTVTFSPQVGIVLVKGGKTGSMDEPSTIPQIDSGQTGTVK